MMYGTPSLTIWALTSGCLIDKDALAFAYGKHSKNKPIRQPEVSAQYSRPELAA